MIGEPADPLGLWQRVGPLVGGWPDSNEDLVAELAAGWQTATTDLATVRDFDPAPVLGVWPDAAGTAFHDGTARLGRRAGTLSDGMRALARHAEVYAGEVAWTKNAIVRGVQHYLPAYAETFALPGAVAEPARERLVVALAAELNAAMEDSAQRVRAAATEAGGTALIRSAGAGPPGEDSDDSLLDHVTDAGRAVGDAIGEVGEGVGEVAGAVGEAAGEIAGDLGEGIGEVAGEIGEGVGTVAGEVGEAAGEFGADVGEAAGELGGGIGEAVGGLFGGANAPVGAAPGGPDLGPTGQPLSGVLIDPADTPADDDEPGPGGQIPLPVAPPEDTENPVSGSYEGEQLADQMRERSAGSLFHPDGTLTEESKANSHRDIEGDKLGNPALRELLTQNGSSISDWGKYSTETVQSPYGDYKVHYYYNQATGQTFYDLDYKSVMNRR